MATKKKTAKKAASSPAKKAAKKTSKKPAAAPKKVSKKTVKTAEPADEKKAPKKAAAPKKVSTSVATSGEMHGVRILGDAKKGGTAKKGVVAQLRLDQIVVVKGLNPRGSVGDITDLARNIKAEGILSSLVVRPAKADGKFELIAGSRRMAALQSLKWSSEIPVIIRTDLADDDHARAVAIADTETGEKHNPVEIGRVLQSLKKKGWPSSRIANETGISTKHVHAMLKLMDTPTDILKRVEDGTMSAKAGIEIGRIPKEERERIAKQIGPDTPAAEIQRIRKELDREDKLDKAAKGEPAKTKKGTEQRRMVVAWRPAREKQLMLQELCYEFVQEWKDEEIDNPQRAEIRGMISALLWDRGDLSQLQLPAEDESEMENVSAGKKALAVFNALIEQAAALHKPDADEVDEGDEGDDEGDDE